MIEIKNLKRILFSICDCYEKLLELLQREKNALINMDLESIDSIVKEKDTLLLKVRLLEEERQRIFLKKGEKDKKLIDIANETNDQSLRDINSKLLSLTQSIDEINNLNRILVDRSIDFIKVKLKLFEFAGLRKERENLLSVEF